MVTIPTYTKPGFAFQTPGIRAVDPINVRGIQQWTGQIMDEYKKKQADEGLRAGIEAQEQAKDILDPVDDRGVLGSSNVYMENFNKGRRLMAGVKREQILTRGLEKIFTDYQTQLDPAAAKAQIEQLKPAFFRKVDAEDLPEHESIWNRNVNKTMGAINDDQLEYQRALDKVDFLDAMRKERAKNSTHIYKFGNDDQAKARNNAYRKKAQEALASRRITPNEFRDLINDNTLEELRGEAGYHIAHGKNPDELIEEIRSGKGQYDTLTTPERESLVRKVNGYVSRHARANADAKTAANTAYTDQVALMKAGQPATKTWEEMNATLAAGGYSEVERQDKYRDWIVEQSGIATQDLVRSLPVGALPTAAGAAQAQSAAYTGDDPVLRLLLAKKATDLRKAAKDAQESLNKKGGDWDYIYKTNPSLNAVAPDEQSLKAQLDQYKTTFGRNSATLPPTLITTFQAAYQAEKSTGGTGQGAIQATQKQYGVYAQQIIEQGLGDHGRYVAQALAHGGQAGVRAATVIDNAMSQFTTLKEDDRYKVLAKTESGVSQIDTAFTDTFAGKFGGDQQAELAARKTFDALTAWYATSGEKDPTGAATATMMIGQKLHTLRGHQIFLPESFNGPAIDFGLTKVMDNASNVVTYGVPNREFRQRLETDYVPVYKEGGVQWMNVDGVRSLSTLRATGLDPIVLDRDGRRRTNQNPVPVQQDEGMWPSRAKRPNPAIPHRISPLSADDVKPTPYQGEKIIAGGRGGVLRAPETKYTNASDTMDNVFTKVQGRYEDPYVFNVTGDRGVQERLTAASAMFASGHITDEFAAYVSQFPEFRFLRSPENVAKLREIAKDPANLVRTNQGVRYSPLHTLEVLGNEIAPRVIEYNPGMISPDTGTVQPMRSNEPRGIRNNNPGNIRVSRVNWQGETEGSDRSFETFETPEAGIRAIGKNLLAYQTKHGLSTVRDLISRWAPDRENDTNSYVAAVADQLGVDPDERLDLKNKDTLRELIAAIIHHENGKQPYRDDLILGAAERALA